MQRDPRVLLEEVVLAAEAILEYVRGKRIEDYRQSRLLRAGVEREFITIGEAIARLRDTHGDLVTRIESGPRIVAFRNHLVHRYFRVDSSVVWATATERVPELLTDARELLMELDRELGPPQDASLDRPKEQDE